MKTEMVSARFAKEDTELIEESAREEKTDKTTALKKIFALGAKQYRQEKAIKQYQEGRISLGKAAELANASLWEIMEKLKRRNIASCLEKEDFLQGLKNLERVWK